MSAAPRDRAGIAGGAGYTGRAGNTDRTAYTGRAGNTDRTAYTGRPGAPTARGGATNRTAYTGRAPGSPRVIRPAVAGDVPVLLRLIRELAAYEREPDAVLASEDDVRAALFGAAPTASCHVAVDAAGEVVGFALWFVNFSTWLGRPGLYLEDLFVRPAARGAGYGKALLGALAAVAVQRGYGRMDWAVLDWNEPAQRFYRALGAAPQEEWTTWRLTGAALTALADQGAGQLSE